MPGRSKFGMSDHGNLQQFQRCPNAENSLPTSPKKKNSSLAPYSIVAAAVCTLPKMLGAIPEDFSPASGLYGALRKIQAGAGTEGLCPVYCNNALKIGRKGIIVVVVVVVVGVVQCTVKVADSLRLVVIVGVGSCKHFCNSYDLYVFLLSH